MQQQAEINMQAETNMQAEINMQADPTPSSEHLERVGYLFGYPITHSMSPLMHQTIFDSRGWNWSQLFLQSRDLSHFIGLMDDPKFFGASVTMPHKLAILPYLDQLTPEAQAVGACNTVFIRKNGSKRMRMGTNTDVIGIREAFYQNIPDPDEVFHNRPGLVVGGGGAARSGVYALKKFMKCDKVYLVNRDKAEVDAVISWCVAHGYGDGLIHVSTAEQAESLEGPGAIVSCIPDFAPTTELEKEARRALETFLAKPHKGAILEMAYHPAPWTAIAEISQQAGWEVILGTEAMIYQGLEQSRHWTEHDISPEETEKVKKAIAQQLSKSHL